MSLFRNSGWPKAVSGVVLSVVFFLVSTSLAAQQVADPPKEASDKPASDVERIQVTGSHIKQLDLQGPSPLQVIGREEIMATGEISLADILRATTLNAFGSRREQTGGTQSGSAYVNLKGLGSSRTLVLLNGRRLPRDTFTSAVDLNFIPAAAIQRIEVLRDGASATYGSDALAGVVNVITKKDFSGNTFSAYMSDPVEPGRDQQSFNFTTGSGTANSNQITVISYQEKDRMFRRDREVLSSGSSSAASPGDVRAVSVENDGSGQQSVEAGRWLSPTCADVTDDCTRHEYWRDSVYFPESKKLSIFNDYTYTLTDDVALFSQVNLTYSRMRWHWGPTSDARNLTVEKSALDTNSQFYQDLKAAFEAADAATDNPDDPTAYQDDFAGAERFDIRTRLTEFGREEKQIESVSYNILGGLSGYIGELAEWEVSFAQNEQIKHELNVSGMAHKARLERLIAAGIFNPLGEANQRTTDPEALESAKLSTWHKKRSIQRFSQAKLTGAVAELPGGSVEAAFGVEQRYEGFNDQVDQATKTEQAWGTQQGSAGAGDRTVISSYVEFWLPVTRKFQLQLAARYDDYNDFGATTNPKIAFNLRPIDNLLLRGSYGTGFKAPSLFELYRDDTLQYSSIDYQGEEFQTLVNQSGNQQLSEERSKSWNVGLFYEPGRYFNIGADYSSIVIDDVISYLDVEDVLNYIDDAVQTATDQGGDAAAAREAAIQQAAAWGVEIPNFTERLPQTGFATTYQNLGRREVKSLSVRVGLQSPRWSWGRLRLNIQHDETLQFKSARLPGEAPTDLVGLPGRPSYRNKISTSWRWEKLLLAVNTRSLGPQKKDSRPWMQNGFHSETDVMVSVDVNSLTRVALGSRNVFDRQIPDDNKYIYDFIGKTYWGSLELSF